MAFTCCLNWRSSSERKPRLSFRFRRTPLDRRVGSKVDEDVLIPARRPIPDMRGDDSGMNLGANKPSIRLLISNFIVHGEMPRRVALGIRLRGGSILPCDARAEITPHFPCAEARSFMLPCPGRDGCLYTTLNILISKEFGRVETSDEPRLPPGSSSRLGRAFLESMMGSRAG